MFKRISFSDQQIVEAIKNSSIEEEKAIGFLMKKNETKIFHFIKGHGGNDADAEDVFQDAVTEMILNIKRKKFQQQSTIDTYLFAICKGIWYKKFNKQGRDITRNEAFFDKEEKVHDPETILMNENQEETILGIFDNLKEKCRDVLHLWSLSFSMKEIAERMRYKNEQIVMNKKNLCLRELKEMIKTNPHLNQLLKELR